MKIHETVCFFFMKMIRTENYIIWQLHLMKDNFPRESSKKCKSRPKSKWQRHHAQKRQDISLTALTSLTYSKYLMLFLKIFGSIFQRSKFKGKSIDLNEYACVVVKFRVKLISLLNSGSLSKIYLTFVHDNIICSFLLSHSYLNFALFVRKKK